MKHILIAGTPRAGKSRISDELTYLGFIHYQLDSIKRGVFSALKLPKNDWELASKLSVSILEKIVDDNEQGSTHKRFFIFDSPHIYPKDVANLDKSQFVIVFLGYIDTTVDKKVSEILQYDDSNCWTQKLDIKELKRLVKGNIEYSKVIKSQCEEFGLPYFDVSFDSVKVLHEVKNYILDNL